VGVIFLDLDEFKAVNDTYGHGAGDKLLELVARRLLECVRTGDTVARLAGDEFAFVLSNLAKAEDASLVAQKIVTALVNPFDLDGHEVDIQFGREAPDHRGARFDLVVANILEGPLERLAPALCRALVPGGILLISGFMRPQIPGLRLLYEATGLKSSGHFSLDEWALLKFGTGA